MQHLDEGTIHAWLDGALSPTEASAAESHVASCAECSAKVAEARGLIAASSRIVGALDHVPAGVIPIAAKPRRSRIPIWSSALAATLLVAVGSLLVQKGRVTPRDSVAISGETKEVRGLDTSVRLSRPQVSAVPAAEAPTAQHASEVPIQVGPPPAAKVTQMRPQVEASPKAVDLSVPAPTVPARPLAMNTDSVAPSARADAQSERQRRALSPTKAVAAASAGAGGGVSRMALQPSSGNFAETRLSFAGCYEDNTSTDVLPRRFALSRDSAGLGDFRQVRYIDSTGAVGPVIPDVVWRQTAGLASIRNRAGTELLALRQAGSAMVALSSTGPRPIRILPCP
jgi:anti-sigma factor RsiW